MIDLSKIEDIRPVDQLAFELLKNMVQPYDHECTMYKAEVDVEINVRLAYMYAEEFLEYIENQ